MEVGDGQGSLACYSPWGRNESDTTERLHFRFLYGSLIPWKESYNKPRQHIKKQRHYFANKGPSSQRYGFSSSHEWMWKLDHKESWVLKNWCFWTVVLEKTLETPLDCKEIQPVHPKGNQSWIFIGRTDAEAEAPILGHLMWRADSLGKILMLGKIKGRRRGDNRGWHGWMASLTQWIWIWASSGSWWWTSKPDMFQSMGSQRVEHDYMTELNRSSHCVFHGIKSRSLFYNGDKSHSWGLSLHGPASKCCHIGY